MTFAIREEAALTLEDIVMRRTGIGQLGNPGNDALEQIADIAVDELGWSETPAQRRGRGGEGQLPDAGRRGMSAFIVVNPASGGGRTRKDWPAIEAALRAVYPDALIAFTRARGEAETLVYRALQKATPRSSPSAATAPINEAVNGFFDENGSVSPDAVFSFVTSGTGGDFRKDLRYRSRPCGGHRTLADRAGAAHRCRARLLPVADGRAADASLHQHRLVRVCRV